MLPSLGPYCQPCLLSGMGVYTLFAGIPSVGIVNTVTGGENWNGGIHVFLGDFRFR